MLKAKTISKTHQARCQTLRCKKSDMSRSLRLVSQIKLTDQVNEE